jgi:host factor-I protein
LFKIKSAFLFRTGTRGALKKMAKDINLQDVFLNQARKERIPVTIYITNGFQFKGTVRGFDSYIVILDTDGKQNMIYKHAISTITPLKSISVFDVFDKEETEAASQ